MSTSRRRIRATLLVCSLAVAAITLGCSDAARSSSDTQTPTGPAKPVVPAKPTIVLSADSLVASAVSGAGVLTNDINVTPGDTTRLHSLAVVAGGFGDGDSGAWLSAQVDTASAPAKISIRVDPARATVGVHIGVLTVSAQAADGKSIRVRFEVRPRPILLADSGTRSLTAQLGDSIPSATVALRSSSDTIRKLSLAPPECGGRTWLSARLSSESTPAVVTLAVDPHGLPSGSFECRVQVQSTQALIDSASRTIVVSLTLRQTPRIAFDLATTQNIAANAGTDATPIRLQISNAGTGTLDGLSAGAIAYEGASGWLTATLDRTVAPATLTLAAATRSLDDGTFKATIPIRSTADGVANSPVLITINLVVAPKPFLFAISPASILLLYSSGPNLGNAENVSFYDANNTGQRASIVRITATPFPGAGTCPAVLMSGPITVTAAIPQTNAFAIAPSSARGNCGYAYTVTLDNGQSAGFTVSAFIYVP